VGLLAKDAGVDLEKLKGQTEKEMKGMTKEELQEEIETRFRDALKQFTVILVVDGMQNFILENKKTDLHQCLTSIGDLNHYGPLWISCCTATVTEPIKNFLNNTHRKRIYLPVAL
jgi:hypothetical protein